MNDHELLELAAKAAGIEGQWLDPRGGCLGGIMLTEFTFDTWNPLADEGDALRLACKLLINIEFDDDGGGVEVMGKGGIEALPADGDLAAATRRAIVRAAAEIGRGV